jgi:hypothetical protein
MLLLRAFFAACLMLAAAGASARSLPKDYAGPDAGYVVYSVGTIQIGMDYNFSYHRVSAPGGAPANDWKSKIEPYLGGAIYLKIKNPDFSGRETGHVIVRRLPPGNYVVDGFFFAGWTPGMAHRWSSKVPFALPFAIAPGQATYIGSFMRAPSLGTPLEPQLKAAGFFVIADRSQRDLPIARAKLPGLPQPGVQVTDVDTLGSFVLRSREPE